MIRLDHFGEEADDGRRGVKFASPLPFGHGEFAQEIFVDPTERVVIERRGNLGDLFQQFLEERTGEKVVGLGQDTGELRIVLLDVAHRVVHRFSHVGGFRQRQEMVETGVRCEVKHSVSVIRAGVFQARAASRRGGGFIQLGALYSKSNFCKAQKDETEDRLGVLRCGEAGVGAELVCGVPKAFFERVVSGVFFRWSYPLHALVCSMYRHLFSLC